MSNIQFNSVEINLIQQKRLGVKWEWQSHIPETENRVYYLEFQMREIAEVVSKYKYLSKFTCRLVRGGKQGGKYDLIHTYE